MNQEEKGRVIGAFIALFAIMGALGWYLSARDDIIADLDAWNEDYAANHSLISRQRPPDSLPKEQRWRVAWQCGEGPKMERIVYDVDGERAVKTEKRRQKSRKACVFEVAPTALPYCAEDRTCGAARIARR